MDSAKFLNEICDALGLPKNVTAVRIEFTMREHPTIEVTYAPTKEQQQKVCNLTRNYELTRKDSGP